MRRPRPQAIRARGAALLPFRLPAWPSPGVPWARGLLSAFWERGSPDLPACGVAKRGAQRGPSSPTQTQDPREGPSLAGRTTQSFLRHGLIRLAHEGAERSRRGTSRGARDASHDDSGRQAGASPRSVPLPLWCKGGKRSRGVPRHLAKAAISVQQDQDQADYETEVTMEPSTASPQSLSQAKTTFSQDKSTCCPPSN